LNSGDAVNSSSNMTPWKLVSFRNTSMPTCWDSMTETNNTKEHELQLMNTNQPFVYKIALKLVYAWMTFSISVSLYKTKLSYTHKNGNIN
jgi:hypothetical protein